MPDNLFIPSVDLRIGSLEEYNRRQKENATVHHRKYIIENQNRAPVLPFHVNMAARVIPLPSGYAKS